MTSKQVDCVRNAIKSIQTARKWLDMAMYYSGDTMPENEFKKVREAYDYLCKANDKL